MRTLITLIAIVSMLNLSVHAEKSKPLILYRIGDIPVEMREGDEYGAMLVNDGWEKDPSSRYILVISKTRAIIDTKDLDLFKAVLKRIPKGSTIFEYDSCTVPRSWGLKDADIQAYNNAIINLELILSEKPRITCYCKDNAKKA